MSQKKEKRTNRKRARRKTEIRAAVLVSFLFLCVVVAGVFGFYMLREGMLSGKSDETEQDSMRETKLQQGDQGDGLEITVIPASETDSENADADAAEEELSDTSEEPEPQDVTMIFTGDICFYDAYANMGALRSRGGSIESSIDPKLLSEMHAADICMVNNEFAYSDRGTPLQGKAYAFRSKPDNVRLLTEMGVDIVSLANNHVYDYGQDALLDTLDILKGEGIPYVGAGKNLKEAAAPYYFEINGRKIAFISATQVERNSNPDTKGATADLPGTFRCFSPEEFQNLTDAVETAEQEADMTIVYIHWGSENTDELHWAQNEQAPKIVAAGADLIIGDHPHVLQGIEYIDGVPVFYSMGNFWFNSKTLDSGMLKAVYTKDGALTCQFIPAKQHDCRTDMESGTERQRILDYMQCISPNVTIDENGNITDKPYDGPEIDYNAVERVPEPPVPQPVPDENGQPDAEPAALQPADG